MSVESYVKHKCELGMPNLQEFYERSYVDEFQDFFSVLLQGHLSKENKLF